MEIIKNEFIILDEENKIIYINVLEKGFTLRQFYDLVQDTPIIRITRNQALQEALLMASNEWVEIGESDPFVTLSLSKDKMQATLYLNCTSKDLAERKDFFVGEALKVLHEHKISEGILVNVLHESLFPQCELIIAKGKEPIHGKDAKVEYFSLSERKPTIRNDGKADYYDMNFIDEVKRGDWLGEKIPASTGKLGKTVTGETVAPKKGKDKKLGYDQKTVGEYEEDGKIVLRALVDGIVTFEGGKITVGEHLVINGDVGIETGNIDFEGSVTVKGVVQNGFSVNARKDISILGEMGLSGTKIISSRKGDIYIKGGIFGQGHSIVKAGKNIFVKHANDCILKAEGDIHIGYYAIGSHLKGRHIFADEKNSKIIGGRVEAKGKVVASIIGNKMERKTYIQVEGFDRETLTEEMEKKLLEYKKGLLSYKTVKSQIEAFENSTLNESQQKRLELLKIDLDNKLTTITEYDDECKYLMNLLEIKGEGEVTVLEAAYPETFIEIKGYGKRLRSNVRGTFFMNDKILRFV